MRRSDGTVSPDSSSTTSACRRTSCRSCRSTCRSKRAGTSYKGLCPFHSEKTPSFHVHPDKGFFHCFGCGVGGDVFKFLELHEKVGFQDAVRMLAQKFGVSHARATEGSGDDARRDAGAAGSAAEDARDRGGVLPRAAGRARRGARPAAAQGARRHAARPSSSSAGLRAAVARRLEGAAAASRDSRRRCCCRAAWSCSATAARWSTGSATG